MSHGRKKDEQNVRTPRSDKGDHRGERGKKNWEMCRKWRGKLGAGQEGETWSGSGTVREMEALTGLNHCPALPEARHKAAPTCGCVTQVVQTAPNTPERLCTQSSPGHNRVNSVSLN